MAALGLLAGLLLRSLLTALLSRGYPILLSTITAV